MSPSAVTRSSFPWSSLAALCAVAACANEPVGRKCDLGITPQENASVLASRSLDCISRSCLKVPLEKQVEELPPGSSYPTGSIGLCTDRCESDDDCERVPESPCVSGFTCGYPIQVGPFCCEKFCVCKDYLLLPESGTPPAPEACDADNPANACCNLPGRRGDPAYPDCAAP